MGSSKIKNKMIFGTSLAIFAILGIGIFSSFESESENIANHGYATTTSQIMDMPLPLLRASQ
jgi:hypothetical protein